MRCKPQRLELRGPGNSPHGLKRLLLFRPAQSKSQMQFGVKTTRSEPQNTFNSNPAIQPLRTAAFKAQTIVTLFTGGSAQYAKSPRR